MHPPARKLAREETSRQGAETGLGLSLPAGFVVVWGEFFSFQVSIKQRRSLPHLLLESLQAQQAASAETVTALHGGEASGRAAAAAHALASAHDLFGGRKVFFPPGGSVFSKDRKGRAVYSPSRWFGGPQPCARLLGCSGMYKLSQDGVVAVEGSRSGQGELRVWLWPQCRCKGRPESWVREEEGEEGLSGGRAGREHSPQPGITLPSWPRDRNQQEPTCQPRPWTRCLPTPRGARGRA